MECVETTYTTIDSANLAVGFTIIAIANSSFTIEYTIEFALIIAIIIIVTIGTVVINLIILSIGDKISSFKRLLEQ